MADDPNARKPPLGEGASAGDGNEPPQSPSLADRLKLPPEEREKLPDDQRAVTLDDLDEFVKGVIGETRTAADREYAERAERERAAAAAQQQQSAAAQTDIDYYNDLKGRSFSADEAVRVTAQAEMEKNETRYQRGAALALQTSQQTQERAVYASFFTAVSNDLEQAGFAGVMPKPGTPEYVGFAAKVNQAKGGFAGLFIEHGKQLGIEEGKRLGREEAEREHRIDDGKDGAPAVKPGAKPATDKFENSDEAMFAEMRRQRREMQRNGGVPLVAGRNARE